MKLTDILLKPNSNSHCLELQTHKNFFRDIFGNHRLMMLIKSRAGFPGGPEVKTLSSHCRGHRFHPWAGNYACCPGKPSKTQQDKTKSRATFASVVIVFRLRTDTVCPLATLGTVCPRSRISQDSSQSRKVYSDAPCPHSGPGG